VRRERFLSEFKPFKHLIYAGPHAGSLFIKDNQGKLVAEIIYKDGLVYCNTPDKDSNYEHVRFDTSLIDIAKYMQEK
jgi:hypothetical protein